MCFLRCLWMSIIVSIIIFLVYLFWLITLNSSLPKSLWIYSTSRPIFLVSMPASRIWSSIWYSFWGVIFTGEGLSSLLLGEGSGIFFFFLGDSIPAIYSRLVIKATFPTVLLIFWQVANYFYGEFWRECYEGEVSHCSSSLTTLMNKDLSLRGVTLMLRSFSVLLVLISLAYVLLVSYYWSTLFIYNLESNDL